jgi:hypothetical protein
LLDRVVRGDPWGENCAEQQEHDDDRGGLWNPSKYLFQLKGPFFPRELNVRGGSTFLFALFKLFQTLPCSLERPNLSRVRRGSPRYLRSPGSVAL